MNLSGNSFDTIWFPFTFDRDARENPPKIVDRGEGPYVFDTDGKAYLDAIGSWWVSIFGHNHPEISAAVRAQLEKLDQVIMAGFVAETTVEAARLLASLLPPPLSRVFFSDDGSTAVEAALKIALQYWALRGENRTGFVALSGAYHGDTLGAMSVGMVPRYHTLFHERFKKYHFAHSPYCYRCPVNEVPHTCRAQCMDSLERILAERGSHLAACIFEPMVQGAVGMRVYPAKVLERIFTLCREHGVLLIADEVAVGFGRTGRMFACHHANRTPDIMCLAKGLTAGCLPMAATAVTEAIYDEFRGDHTTDRILHHGHSFTGSPPAAAAACASLRMIMRERIPESLEGTIDYFLDGLRQFDEFEIVGDIRGLGMIGALELVSDRATRTPPDPADRTAYRICREAVSRGVILRPLGDVVYFMPPYILSTEQIDTMFRVCRESIHHVLNHG